MSAGPPRLHVVAAKVGVHCANSSGVSIVPTRSISSMWADRPSIAASQSETLRGFPSARVIVFGVCPPPLGPSQKSVADFSSHRRILSDE